MNVGPVSAEPVLDALDVERADVPGPRATSLGELDGSAFMRLLVEQLRNQDPTEPLSATDYVAQLATFAEVEQSVAIRQSLEESMRADALAQADAVIGRRVTSADGLAEGIVASVRLTEDGLVALTREGAEIAIGPGIVVAESAPGDAA